MGTHGVFEVVVDQECYDSASHAEVGGQDER